MPDIKSYLGDGLYVSYDGYQFCLKANDADEPSDTVYLDPEVMAALDKFRERVKGL